MSDRTGPPRPSNNRRARYPNHATATFRLLARRLSGQRRIVERHHTCVVSLPPNLGEPTLDLHGLRLREALQRTDAFLRREQAQGTVAVRIITGHGGGILKQAIGDLLAQHPSVARVTTALQGDAARVVVLRPRHRR